VAGNSPAPAAPPAQQVAPAPAPPVTPGSKAWAEMTTEQRHAQLRGPENPRARGHSPAIEAREAAAARASGEAPPVAGQQPPPAKTDAPAASGDKHKFGEMEFSEQELKDFLTEKGARELRKATLPASPTDYKTELPANFEMPGGLKVEFNETDPLLVDARNWAHGKGFSQSEFSELVGIYASAKAKEAAFINQAASAELGKLGANAVQRVSAIETWLRGQLGDDLAAPMKTVMVTEKIVRGWETIMHKFQSQGTASFSQAHRVAPDGDKIPGFENMSFAQQRHAQEQLRERGNLR
jgi:hypothetical protein